MIKMGKTATQNSKLVQVGDDWVRVWDTPEDQNNVDMYQTTKWRGVSMLKTHSFQRAVYKAVIAISHTQVVSHVCLGAPSDGKSELMDSIAHVAHIMLLKKYGYTFQVKRWGKEQLRNLKESLENDIKTHTILMFDDTSFEHNIMSQKQKNEVLREITTIRHRPGVSKDLRIMLLFATHYGKAIAPITRGSEFYWALSAKSPLERKNLSEVFSGYLGTIRDFERKRIRTITSESGRWGPTGPNTPEGQQPQPMYKFRDPFAPVLFYDGFPRWIAYPTRQWIAPDGCGICDTDDEKKQHKHTNNDISNMLSKTITKYGRPKTTSAIKVLLTKYGYDVYDHTTYSAIKHLHTDLIERGVSPSDLHVWIQSYNEAKKTNRKAADAARNTEEGITQ